MKNGVNLMLNALEVLALDVPKLPSPAAMYKVCCNQVVSACYMGGIINTVFRIFDLYI